MSSEIIKPESVEAKSIQSLNVKPEVLAKAKEISQSLDITKRDSISNLGLESQQKLGNFSSQMMDRVKVKDSGEVGDVINQLLVQIHNVDIDTLKENPLTKIPIIGPVIKAISNKSTEIISKYQSVSSNIEDIKLKMDETRISLSHDNNALDIMFQKNLEHVADLDASIIAGKIKAEELRNVISNFHENDGIEDYVKSDTVRYLDRLEKKVHDLFIVRNISLQTLPEIRMIQDNNIILEEKILSAVHNTIPLWQNQVVIALAMQKQKKAIDVEKKVTQTTNDLLAKNAQLLKMNSIETAKANEESIADVNVLKKTQQDIIETLNEINKIKEEGKKKRQVAQIELMKSEIEMKAKILAIGESIKASTPVNENHLIGIKSKMESKNLNEDQLKNLGITIKEAE